MDSPLEPPADVHHPADGTTNTQTPAPAPNKTGRAIKKRKRSLSYKAKKGSNNQKSSSRPHPHDISVPALSTTEEAVITPGPIDLKKTMKGELLKLLRQCQKEFAQSQKSNRQKDAAIARLTKKNNLLLASSQSTRGAAREAKKYAKTVEDCARVSERRLTEEVFAAKEVAHQQSVGLRRKDAEWETIVRDKVAEAREQEQDRKQRAIAVEERKLSKALKQREAEFHNTLKQKDKQIKFISDLADKSRNLTKKLQQEKLKVLVDTKLSLDEKDVAHGQAISAVKKQSASVIQQKAQIIRELRTDVKEMEELAIDVAVEHLDETKKLEISLAKAEKCNAAKEQRLAKSAAHRLAKVKQSNALMSELQSTLDEERYEKDMVLLENEWLKDQVDGIGNELIDAYHTIEELKPYVIEKKGKTKTWDPRLTQLVVEMLANRTPQFVNPGRERASGDEDNSKSLGAMIKLPIELQASLMVAGKRYAPRLRKAYDNALATQHKDTLERQKLAGMKACRDKEEEYIEALDYLQRFNSNRCWRSKERALEVYNALPSEAARLKAVKEQITIRRKGTIGERAGHKWSQNGYYYTSRELLDHFINVILPMEANEPVPTEPPVDFGGIVSDQHRLGTMTELYYINDNINGVSIEQIKENALKERERRMAGGETDQDANL